MNNLPFIFKQRWAAAVERPSLMQWHSVAVWFEDAARSFENHPHTRHMAADLRELAAKAWREVAALQPVEVAA